MSSGSDLVHAESVEVRRFIFSVMQSFLIRRCVGFFGDLQEQTEKGPSEEDPMKSYLKKKITGGRRRDTENTLQLYGFSYVGEASYMLQKSSESDAELRRRSIALEERERDMEARVFS